MKYAKYFLTFNEPTPSNIEMLFTKFANLSTYFIIIFLMYRLQTSSLRAKNVQSVQHMIVQLAYLGDMKVYGNTRNPGQPSPTCIISSSSTSDLTLQLTMPSTSINCHGDLLLFSTICSSVSLWERTSWARNIRQSSMPILEANSMRKCWLVLWKMLLRVSTFVAICSGFENIYFSYQMQEFVMLVCFFLGVGSSWGSSFGGFGTFTDFEYRIESQDNNGRLSVPRLIQSAGKIANPIVHNIINLHMQDSFLENDDESSMDTRPRIKIPYSSQKMYNIELTFLTNFIKQISQIHNGIQQVLVELTKCQEGQKKRLPYSVLRSFEKYVKEIRLLKQKTVEENGVYLEEVQNRQKAKTQRSNLFKQYLKQLGQKRQELKVYLNKLETRVRKLEDNGYAQFIEYDVVVPEVNTIRFSYSQKSFFILLTNRNNIIAKLTDEIRRRKEILGQAESSAKIQGNQEQQKNRQRKVRRNIKLPLILNECFSLTSVLSFYKSYKFFSNQCVINLKLLKIRSKKQQLQLEINRLKQALKMNEQLLYKQKLRNGVLCGDPNFTKTDHLILLKQMQVEIKEKVQKRIFLRKQSIKKYRSKSCNK